MTTAVFQWEWFHSLFGFDSGGLILSFIPILVTGILYGLAMVHQNIENMVNWNNGSRRSRARKPTLQRRGETEVQSEQIVLEHLVQKKRTSAASVVVMTCGVAGSGKTTFAQKLEKEGFVRLSIDEEIWKTHGRYGMDYAKEQYASYQEEAERKLQKQLVELIRHGHDAVVDFSFWQRQTRDAYKQLVERNGGVWKLIYFRVPPDELRQRLLVRNNRFDANAAFPITEELFTTYVTGFETPSGEGETVVETGHDSRHF